MLFVQYSGENENSFSLYKTCMYTAMQNYTLHSCERHHINARHKTSVQNNSHLIFCNLD